MAVFDAETPTHGAAVAALLNGSGRRIVATVVDRAAVEEGGLATYDCVVARLSGFEDDSPSAATRRALRAFVAGGGGYVGEWQGAAAALSAAHPPSPDDFGVPDRFLGLFGGRAGGGTYLATDHPIEVVADHAVVRGLSEVFTGGGGTEHFVRASGLDRRLEVVARYQDAEGTAHPAVAAGGLAASRVVLLFFDALDEPQQPSLRTLWLNTIRFACPPGW